VRELVTVEHDGESGVELRAPHVGRFTASVGEGDVVGPGGSIGRLNVMNSQYVLRVPAGVSGVVSFVAPRSGTGYQEPLVVLQSLSVSIDGKVGSGPEAHEGGAGGLEIRSPIDGIFYCRPSPEDPPFVSAGDEVVLGQTLGLIEVMKTFNPVKLEGVGMPDRATVLRVCVRDQEEVSSGQLVLEVEPLA